MDSYQFVAVPIIVAAVYGIINVIKRETKGSIKNIPILAAVIGAILGGIAFFAAPDIMPVSDVFTAVLTGGASGLAATGSHQVLKQMVSKEDGSKNSDSGNNNT